MKNLIMLLGCILLFRTPAFARLGETPDECASRYGSAIGNAGRDQVVYRRSGLTITVHFENGKSSREDFAPESAGMLSDDQVTSLLQENAEGSSWEKSGETAAAISYFRKDSHASAQLAKPNQQGSGRLKLTVTGVELIIKSI